MRPKASRPTPVQKVLLNLQVLEDRVPSSEQIGSVVRTVMLSAIATGLGRVPAAGKMVTFYVSSWKRAPYGELDVTAAAE